MRRFILYILFGKWGDIMAVATLWANEILNENATFAQVPRLLKDKVKTILTNAGFGHLATE